MHRRKFCKTALATGLAASLPGCDVGPSGASRRAARTINAITGAGDEVNIERAAVSELADSLQGSLYLPSDETYDVARPARTCVDEPESGIDLELGCLTHAPRG